MDREGCRPDTFSSSPQRSGRNLEQPGSPLIPHSQPLGTQSRPLPTLLLPATHFGRMYHHSSPRMLSSVSSHWPALNACLACVVTCHAQNPFKPQTPGVLAPSSFLPTVLCCLNHTHYGAPSALTVPTMVPLYFSRAHCGDPCALAMPTEVPLPAYQRMWFSCVGSLLVCRQLVLWYSEWSLLVPRSQFPCMCPRAVS